MNAFKNFKCKNTMILDFDVGISLGNAFLSTPVLNKDDFTDLDEFRRFQQMKEDLQILDRWQYQAVPGDKYLSVEAGDMTLSSKIATEIPADAFAAGSLVKVVQEISGSFGAFAGDAVELSDGKAVVGTSNNGIVIYDPIAMQMLSTDVFSGWYSHIVKGQSNGQEVLAAIPYATDKGSHLKWSYDGTTWYDSLTKKFGGYGANSLEYCNGVFLYNGTYDGTSSEDSKRHISCTSDIASNSWTFLSALRAASLVKVSDNCVLATGKNVDLLDISSVNSIAVRNVAVNACDKLHQENTRLVFEYDGKTHVLLGGCDNILFSAALTSDADEKMQLVSHKTYIGSDFTKLDGTALATVPTTKSIVKYGNKLFYNDYNSNMYVADISDYSSFKAISSDIELRVKSHFDDILTVWKDEHQPLTATYPYLSNYQDLSIYYEIKCITESGFKTIGNKLYFICNSGFSVKEDHIENGRRTSSKSIVFDSPKDSSLFLCDYDEENNFMKMQRVCNVSKYLFEPYLQ